MPSVVKSLPEQVAELILGFEARPPEAVLFNVTRFGRSGPSFNRALFVELPSANPARQDVIAIMQENILEFSLSEKEGCMVIRRGLPMDNLPITRLAPDEASYPWWKNVLQKIRQDHSFWNGLGFIVKYEAQLRASVV